MFFNERFQLLASSLDVSGQTRRWPNITDDDLPDLTAWRNWYVLGS